MDIASVHAAMVILLNMHIHLCPAVLTPIRVSYIGCFIDYTNSGRDMKDMQGISQLGSEQLTDYGCVRNSNMSIKKCIGICSLGGFLFIGLQNGNECFCGNSYGTQGAANNNTECNKSCAGNSSQICGGTSRISVYRLEYAKGFYCSQFVKIARSSIVTLAGYKNPIYRSRPAESIVDCLFQCRDGCLGALIAQQQQPKCYLLSFALLPHNLSSIGGEFYVRN